MAKRIRMINSANGLTKDGFYGFSWTTLFFGGFPALFRSDFLTFIGFFAILLIVGMFTFGIAIFIALLAWAFMYNKYYTRRLVERGFRFDGGESQNKEAAAAIGVSL